MRKITKLRRSIRAISPVISVLLMIAVAVVASLVAYAWVMGYIGFQTAKTGQAIQIQSYAPGATGHMIVYVQNIGDSDVAVGSVYINNALVAINSPTDLTVTKGNTIALDVTSSWTPGTQVEIKVTTTGGTFSDVKGTGTNGGGSGGGTPTATPTPVLDHFTFDTISGTITAGTPFSITIRAIDQNGAAFTSYTGTNTLTEAPTGTVTPSPTTAFTAGVWTGQVTLSQSGTGISISTSGGGKSGASNTFTVNTAGPTPHYVDTNTQTHDNPNIGTHSSFASMKDDGNYDTLTEASSYGTQRLDLEVQFTGVTNYAQYGHVEIKTGAFSTPSETITVYYWNGYYYTPLGGGTGQLTASTTNTFTVTMTSSTLQLQFSDGTQFGDTTANTWQIDYVRLVA